MARSHDYLDGWIEVMMRDSVISDTSGGWALSYAVRADVGGANVLDTSTASTHPNALVAFLDIPVGQGVEPARPQPTLGVETSASDVECNFRWFNLLGIEESWKGTPALAETFLRPGAYFYVQTCGGQISTGKWLIRGQ